MKTKYTTPLMIACAISLVACNTDKSENFKQKVTDTQINNNQTVTVLSHIEVTDATFHIDGMSLNKGEKWKANIETTTQIKNMQEILDSFEQKNDGLSIELGNNLQKELDELFKACNMKGEPHNQLHTYLMPLLEMVSEAKDKPVSKSQLAELNNYLAVYFKYFQ